MTLAFAFTVFFGAIGLLVGRRVLGDNSFLTHLATGNLILEQGSIPRTDPYSFTANGEPWVVQSWLASLLYASLDRLLGGFGIRLMNGVLCAGVGALVWRLTSRRSEQVFVPLGLTGCVLIIGSMMWSPRPLLFGLLGLTLVLAVLDDMMKPAWLLPIMWVWVNTHGSFPLAGVLVGTMVVGAWLDDRRLPVREVRLLTWVGAGTLLGALNPLGPRLLWFPLQLLRRGDALDNVVEWRPFQLDGVVSWVFVVVVAAFVASLIAAPRWRVIVPGTVFTIAALLAVRNIVMASVVLAVVSAPGLVVARGQMRTSDSGPIARVLFAGSVALALIATLGAVTEPVDVSGYPVAEMELLEAEGYFQTDQRVLHPEVVGNYLTLHRGSGAGVFVDDRFDFYPQQVIDDLEVMLYGGDYASVVDRYSPAAILWKSGGGFEAWLRAREEWVVADPLATDVEDNDEPAETTWFIARRARTTPSPAVLASNP